MFTQGGYIGLPLRDMENETELSPKLVRDLMTVGVPTCPPHTSLVDEAAITCDRVVAISV